jgi:hypothetical protein
MIKAIRMRLVGHVARMGRRGMHIGGKARSSVYIYILVCSHKCTLLGDNFDNDVVVTMFLLFTASIFKFLHGGVILTIW